MNKIDKALESQLKNLQDRCGKSLEELFAIIRDCGRSKHGEIRDMLKRDLGMGHGDANTLVHVFRSQQEPADGSNDAIDPLDSIYVGKKAHLRPIHEKLMKAIHKFGEFEIAPKKTYVSLRRKKQFAMIGPATQTRVDVGLNVKGLQATDRLIALPAGQMCQFKVQITNLADVDQELIDWVRTAYQAAE
ncbi:MAG: DUF4287 domain-containing protein [Planctomycetales bacterium]|nr:DUF4287 domain-containing protein [Planctomycetales bacterium]MCA9180272.1 DUF4287 domain-containing protein [Planctomycetales bacterium]